MLGKERGSYVIIISNIKLFNYILFKKKKLCVSIYGALSCFKLAEATQLKHFSNYFKYEELYG